MNKIRKQRIITALLLFCALPLAACSFLVNGQHWQPETTQDKWTAGKVCKGYEVSDVQAAILEYKEVSVSVCPHLKGGSAVAFGPPGLPVIPNPFALSSGDKTEFVVVLAIDSKAHVTKIDLSEITLKLSDKIILHPVACAIVEGVNRKVPIETKLATITNKAITYELQFNYPKSQVSDVSVDLGIISIDNENFATPPLKYRNDPSLKVFPLVIGS